MSSTSTAESFHQVVEACDGASHHNRLSYDSREGFLLLRLEDKCGFAYKIGDWNEGLSVWRKEQAGAWTKASEDPQLPLRLTDFTAKRSPAAHWAETIPLEVRACAKPLQYCCHTVLRFLRYMPQSMDLMNDNPNLLWMLGHAIYEDRLTETEAMNLLGEPRRHIAKAICGQGSNTMVNFFRKIVPACCDQNTAKMLDNLAKEPGFVANIARFEKYPVLLVDELKRDSAISKCRFFKNETIRQCLISLERAKLRQTKMILSDCRQVGRALHISEQAVDKATRSCPSVAVLQSLHDRWTRRLNERAMKMDDSEEDVSFPPPPLPGNPDIVPIVSFSGLKLEGTLMHHCVVSYRSKVIDGQSYIYRVLTPQRATLELERRGDKWVLSQIRCSHNQKPDTETKRSVDEWLEANS